MTISNGYVVTVGTQLNVLEDLGRALFENRTPPSSKFYDVKFMKVSSLFLPTEFQAMSNGEAFLVDTQYGKVRGERRIAAHQYLIAYLTREAAIKSIVDMIKTRVKHGYSPVGSITLKIAPETRV
jgi:hypothetical protein